MRRVMMGANMNAKKRLRITMGGFILVGYQVAGYFVAG